jgi:O-acetylserine/cysteine efflux transporter
MFLLGSAYPTAKLGINASMPPILFGAIRMVIVFICLLPFLKFKLPNKKYLLPLFGFAFSMGAGVNLFLYLSVNASSILSPLVIGAQLSVPLGIIFSSIFLGESISYKKWILIISSFLGITLIGFDPKIADEILGFLLICSMAFFYASAQVFSRYLKELDVKFTNAFMGAFAFIVLVILSIFFEGNTISHLKNLNFEAWVMVLHAGVLCSLMGHMSMFYLYKFYSVGRVLPFYALFPVFGMLLSFFIFGEIPTIIMMIGGLIVVTSVFLLQKIR